jgi:hypothetical protein
MYHYISSLEDEFEVILWYNSMNGINMRSIQSARLSPLSVRQITVADRELLYHIMCVWRYLEKMSGLNCQEL